MMIHLIVNFFDDVNFVLGGVYDGLCPNGVTMAVQQSWIESAKSVAYMRHGLESKRHVMRQNNDGTNTAFSIFQNSGNIL